MTQVKVRHALATWQDEPGGPVLTAFRGQTVEMPEAEAARLRRHAAVVSPDLELDRPGILLELPQAPDDEELIAWVMAASASEVQVLAHSRPELAARLEAAATRITDERRRMDDHLSSVRQVLGGSRVIEDDIVLDTGTPATGTDDDAPPPPPPPPPLVQEETPGAEQLQQPTSLSQLVSGSVPGIAAYLREHPEEAQDVLEAENEARQGQPRAGVVAAVQAAIAVSNP